MYHVTESRAYSAIVTRRNEKEVSHTRQIISSSEFGAQGLRLQSSNYPSLWSSFIDHATQGSSRPLRFSNSHLLVVQRKRVDAHTAGEGSTTRSTRQSSRTSKTEFFRVVFSVRLTVRAAREKNGATDAAGKAGTPCVISAELWCSRLIYHSRLSNSVEVSVFNSRATRPSITQQRMHAAATQEN